MELNAREPGRPPLMTRCSYRLPGVARGWNRGMSQCAKGSAVRERSCHAVAKLGSVSTPRCPDAWKQQSGPKCQIARSETIATWRGLNRFLTERPRGPAAVGRARAQRRPTHADSDRHRRQPGARRPAAHRRQLGPRTTSARSPTASASTEELLEQLRSGTTFAKQTKSRYATGATVSGGLLVDQYG